MKKQKKNEPPQKKKSTAFPSARNQNIRIYIRFKRNNIVYDFSLLSSTKVRDSSKNVCRTGYS